MELSGAEKVRLGIFVLAGIVVLTTALGVLVGVSLFSTPKYYDVFFTESVAGLSPNSEVQYRGLRVGKVEWIQIAANDPEAIHTRLAIEKDITLYEGTKAILASSGLTGLKTINLVPGDIRKGELPSDSVIPSGQSFTDQLKDSALVIAQRLENLTTTFDDWTKTAQGEASGEFIESLSKLTNTLERFLNESQAPFNQALGDFSSLANEAQATLRSSRRIMDAFQSSPLNAAVGNLSSAMKSLDSRLSEAEMGDTVVKLNKALGDITNVLQEMELVVRAGREDAITSIRYLRQAAQDVREFSRMIAQDPSILLRGREFNE